MGAVASRFGVTVRALHHWDAVGLVLPSLRSTGGHRLYTASDLARLRRVLLYRELDVPLHEIGPLLEAPAEEAAASLLRQRDRLRERTERLRRKTGDLERLIEARRSGPLLSEREQAEVFGERWRPSWNAGARERWGGTEQWAQYAERAAQRGAGDWKEVSEAVEEVHAKLTEAHRASTVPGSERADALAEEHRAAISAYFDCTHAMHVCIARLYTTDPGFTAFLDAVEGGLATWLREVVEANARSHGVCPETASWD